MNGDNGAGAGGAGQGAGGQGAGAGGQGAGGAGGAGGGQGAGGAGAGSGQGQGAGAGAGGAGGQGAGQAQIPAELAAQIKTLTDQVTALTADKTKAEADAEAARKSKQTDAEKLAEERAAFQNEVATTKKGLVQEARNQALDKLGVLDSYRGFAPDVDPRTSEGARQLELWAKDHPEILKRTDQQQQQSLTAAPDSKLAKALAGAIKSPFISAAGLRKLVGG